MCAVVGLVMKGHKSFSQRCYALHKEIKVKTERLLSSFECKVSVTLLHKRFFLLKVNRSGITAWGIFIDDFASDSLSHEIL